MKTLFILFASIVGAIFLSCESENNLRHDQKTGDFYRKCAIERITEIESDSLCKNYVVETDCGKSIIKTTGDYKYKKGDTIIIRD